MTYEQKDNAGSLFKNEDRTESNNQPNARGKCRIGGVEYRVSAWTRTSAAGAKFQSLKFEPETKPAAARGGNDKVIEDESEDAPFPF
jgi:hypothetical protein